MANIVRRSISKAVGGAVGAVGAWFCATVTPRSLKVEDHAQPRAPPGQRPSEANEEDPGTDDEEEEEQQEVEDQAQLRAPPARRPSEANEEEEEQDEEEAEANSNRASPVYDADDAYSVASSGAGQERERALQPGGEEDEEEEDEDEWEGDLAAQGPAFISARSVLRMQQQAYVQLDLHSDEEEEARAAAPPAVEQQAAPPPGDPDEVDEELARLFEEVVPPEERGPAPPLLQQQEQQQQQQQQQEQQQEEQQRLVAAARPAQPAPPRDPQPPMEAAPPAADSAQLVGGALALALPLPQQEAPEAALVAVEPAQLVAQPAGGALALPLQQEEPEAASALAAAFRALSRVAAGELGFQNALAQLRAIRQGAPEDFPDVVERCAHTIVADSDASGTPTAVASTLLCLVGTAAVEAESEDGAPGRLLGWLLSVLGHPTEADAKPAGPADGGARRRCAELLELLLRGLTCKAAGPKRGGRRDRDRLVDLAILALHRLARDRLPSVRLPAARGLGALLPAKGAAGAAGDGVPEVHKELLRLAGRDPAAAVRAAATTALNGQGVAPLLAPRGALDVAPAVRRRLFSGHLTSALAEACAGPTAKRRRGGGDDRGGEAGGAAPQSPRLLCLGLMDTDLGVRRACEKALRTWFRKEGGRPEAALRLLATLDVDACRQDELTAEVAVRVLAGEDQWRAALLSAVADGPAPAAAAAAPEEGVAVARALMWRALAPRGWSAELAARTLVVAQASSAQTLKRSGVLRQLLLALCAEGAHRRLDEASLADWNALGVVALLRAPVPRASEQRSCSVFDLAAALLHQAALWSGGGEGGGVQKAFAAAIASVLSRLREGPDPAAGAASSSSSDVWVPDEPAVAMAALGVEVDALLRDLEGACSGEEGAQDQAASEAALVGLRAVAPAFLELAARGLAVVEAAHGQMPAGFTLDGGPGSEPQGVLWQWIRDTLVRADRMDGFVPAGTTMAVRSRAMRCLALHTAAVGETSWEYWEFFSTCMERYGALLPTLPPDGDLAAAAGATLETCVHFLSDTLLLHGAGEPAPGGRARGFLEALLHLLGLPSCTLPPGVTRAPLAPPLRRGLTRCLCTLLLHCGAWGREEDAPPWAARWALAWLLLEAFGRPPGAADAAPEGADDAAGWQEAAEEAAQRGRLLRFFTCMGRCSAQHAALLAEGVEVLLATDLWQLSVARRGGRPPALQLARLLRLVCRQLLPPSRGERAAGELLTARWLRCVWRPLALLAADTAGAEEQACLVEGVRAAVSAFQAGSAEALPDTWARAAAEAASLLEHAAAGAKRAAAAPPLALPAPGCGGGGCGGGEAEAAPEAPSQPPRSSGGAGVQLLRLAQQLRGCAPEGAGADLGPAAAEDALQDAARRRQEVQAALSTMRADFCAVAAAAGGSQPSSARKRKKASQGFSDDDSDQPPARARG